MVSKLLKTHYLKSYEHFWKFRFRNIFLVLTEKTKNVDKKNPILGAESSKILKVQKWCQNGLKPISKGVIGCFRKSD